jgi:PKD repeat protein
MRVVIFTLIMLFLAGTANQTFSQTDQDNTKKTTKTNETVDPHIDNMGYWMKMAEKGLIPYNASVPVKPAEYKGSQIEVKGIMVADSPDVPVTNLTNVTESENSVFIDPDNNQYVLNSNNSTSWSGGSVGTLYGANYFQTSNGGSSWGGTPSGAGGSNSGDPAAAIGRNGRQFVNYISNSSGQGVAYSDNGTSWSTATIAPKPGTGLYDLADKNHMWIDNSLTSPYNGNLYAAWTDFGGTYNYRVVFSRCTNNGVTWSTRIPISNPSSYFSHGVNLQTGPNGEVYACWALYPSSGSLTENAIGFNKSTNGGSSFGTATNAITNINGIRDVGVLKNMRVNSFPVMAVDISGGANNGNIYIVWTNIGTPVVNTGTNKSVYMIKSTNGGTSWSTAVKVNQGAFTNGKEAYSPWITCDIETGALAVVFYDDRNTSSTACETWVAYSTDAGSTWTDFRVSDVSFTPNAIPGLASSYMGDYLGITAKGGRVYPCWTDTRNGLYMTYVSPFTLGLNAAFTANNTNVCTGSSVSFTDQSSGSPTSWSWSFPGGSPSTYSGQNPPAIVYNTPGSYNVSLTVSNGVTNHTETKTNYINVSNVFADFTGTPTTVVVGNTVTFTDNSSCSPTSWSWTFTGGTPSTATGPGPHVITYNTIGTYNVSLTVTKSASNDTKTKTGYINVINAVFNMTNATITTCSGNFYDSGGSSGSYANNENFTETFYPATPGAKIKFIFSSFSTEANYDYLRIYDGINTSATLIGTYNGTTGPGTVTATNASGALTFNFTSDGSVTATGWAAAISCVGSAAPPVANFSASTTTPGVGATVNFTDLSTNIPTSWAWSFSPATVTYVGGTTSTSQNPQVQFNSAGYYTVTLTATNSAGSDGETKTNYILAIAPPVANFSASTTTPSVGQTVTFTDLSTNAPTIWSWSFSPITVTYVGGTTSVSQNPQVQFNSGGFYTVTLTATNTAGSDGETKANYINVLVPPIADFDADTYSPIVGQTVYFWDMSLNYPTSWSWSFSPTTVTFTGGTDATSMEPQVIFTVEGSYTVTLIATNEGGSDSETKNNFINIPYPPVTDFFADITTPYIGQTVYFTDLTTNNPSMWNWNFNPNTVTYMGGTSFSSQNPQVQFNANGPYTVILMASGTSGSDTKTKTDYILVQNAMIDLDITVYLEGPFNGTGMTPNLNGILPLSQPYNVSPWNYAGTENVPAIPNPNIVDWLLVELRDASDAGSATAATIMDRQAAFLLSNGKVVAMDGSSHLQFNNALTQQLFVVIWHRNHIGVMSSDFLFESAGTYAYDFSTGATQAYGTSDAHKQIAPGIWGMMGGDGNGDGSVTETDKSPIWESESGNQGYLNSDYNLDRQSDNKDKDDVWAPNLGKGSQVPN